MDKINKLIVYLFFLLIACGGETGKKQISEEKLKKGAELYTKYGCVVCHSLEGKVIYGPPLNGIFMKNVKVVRQGQEFTIVADRDYLKKAISEPRFEKVLEYKNKEMPLTSFSEEEIEILVEYLISFKDENQSVK